LMRATASDTLSCSFADVAQLVEQRIRNAWVSGSNPLIGSINSAIYTSTPRNGVPGNVRPRSIRAACSTRCSGAK
jgi:hypothetical protein